MPSRMKHMVKLAFIFLLTLSLVFGDPRKGVRDKKRTKAVSKGPAMQLSHPPSSNIQYIPADHVAVATTPSVHILGDLTWLFCQVDWVALLFGLPLVFKAMDKVLEETSTGYINRIGKSLTNPNMHSMVFVSFLIIRYMPFDFALESCLGAFDQPTLKFIRLTVVFHFAGYMYRDFPEFIKEMIPMVKQYGKLFAISFGCVSYFFPVIAMCGIAYGEIVSFFFPSKPEHPSKLRKDDLEAIKEALKKDLEAIKKQEDKLIMKVLSEVKFSPEAMKEFKNKNYMNLVLKETLKAMDK